LIISAGFIQSRLYPELFDLTWQTYLAGGTMPLIGFAIGFILSSIFCLGIKQKLAIGFETGIQNTSLALTVIAVTYKSSFLSSYYSQFIILYTTVQVNNSQAVLKKLRPAISLRSGDNKGLRKEETQQFIQTLFSSTTREYEMNVDDAASNFFRSQREFHSDFLVFNLDI
jgi:hypothetical protein